MPINKKIAAVLKPLKSVFLRRLLAVAGALLALPLVFFAYKQHQSQSPIAVAPAASALQSRKGENQAPALLYVRDHKNHPNLALLIAAFERHNPDLKIALDTQKAADVHIGLLDKNQAPKDAAVFAYAFVDDAQKPLYAFIDRPNEAALRFYDFMLSSNAQDLWIDEGLMSIEPYRDFSHAFFR